MLDPRNNLISRDVCISVPGNCTVVVHDHVAGTLRFCESNHFPKELFDWKTIVDLGKTYEIRLGSHILVFGAGASALSLAQSLAGYLQEMSREVFDESKLDDCYLGEFPAKREGGYSREFSSILWCARVGNSLVHIHFSGKGVPSDAIKSEVDSILATLRLPS